MVISATFSDIKNNYYLFKEILHVLDLSQDNIFVFLKYQKIKMLKSWNLQLMFKISGD